MKYINPLFKSKVCNNLDDSCKLEGPKYNVRYQITD